MSTLKTNNIQHVDRSDPSIIINTDGSVNIAGTMTYEDVTNVDAVGIITGRSNIDAQKQVHVGTGVSIKSGGINVTAGITTVQALQATTGAFTGNLTITNTAPQISLVDSDNNSDFSIYGAAGSFNIYDETNSASRLLIASDGTVTVVQGLLLSSTLTIPDSIIHSGDTNTKIRFPSADTFTVETGGSERFRVASDGKIGMDGSTSPEEALDIGNNTQVNLKVGGRGYLGQGYSTAATILGHSVKAKTTGTVSGGMEVTETNSGGGAPTAIRMQSGNIEFHAAASGTQGATFDSEKFRITSAGDLGINVTSPSAKLDVVDDSASGYIAEFRQGSTSNSAQILIDSPTNADSRPALMEFSRAGTLQWSIGQGYNSSGGAFHLATSSLSAGVTGVKASFLAGGGLTFNGDTAAANALDDYEEGTHNPTMVNLDVPSHVTVDHFNYTKIGRLVHFNAKFTVSGSINDVSGFGFSLPFTQAGSRENVFTAISNRSGSNTDPFAFVVNANQSNAYAKELDGFANATYNSFSTNVVLVTGTYESN